MKKLDYSGHWTGPVFCERCKTRLDPRKIVWLELDQTTGEYIDHELPEGHESQGAFPFGKDCAIKIMKETKKVQS